MPNSSAIPAPPCSTRFAATLEKHGFELKRGRTTTLQVNVGHLCDLACRHCHLEAGPDRQEIMTRATMAEVIAYAARARFDIIDITGGAPELVPGIDYLLSNLAPLTGRMMFRSNLTALYSTQAKELPELLRNCRTTIVASFPSTNAGQADAQRGKGIFSKSIEALRNLNSIGYGLEGSGLELNLAVNPAGAFLPPPQNQAERKFRQDLLRKHGITFNQLFAFANIPLGRFLRWLEISGNLESYVEKLASCFNPDTLPGLMCRSLVSIAWDGYLYDCDFNLAAGQPSGGIRKHVSDMQGLPEEGILIPTGDYCYACTAGTGFT